MSGPNHGEGEAPGDPIMVDASAVVGSERLASALAAGDVSAIGQALRHDFVVVPLMRTATGEQQNRVFELDQPASTVPYIFCLFSSAQTLAAYLGSDSERELSLSRGPALIPFLTQHQDVIDHVVFDPAGPHPMMASVADVLWSLQAQPGDDEVAWIASSVSMASGEADAASSEQQERLEEFPQGGDISTARPIALDIALSKEWFVIDLDDEKVRDAQITELLERQLRSVRIARSLRSELTQWMRESSTRAAAAGGRFLAYFLQRNEKAALALNLAMYWHELGPAIGDHGHLERVAERIQNELREGDELAEASTQAGRFVRHVRLAAGAEELGASDVQLLVVDYWLEFPNRRGLCLVNFSSPHILLRPRLLLLMDNIILGGAWVLESDIDPAG